MPLPLAHAALGLTTHELVGENQPIPSLWRKLALIGLLANLPDVDMVIGLILQGDGSLFHRGPTHSLLFAAGIGWLASRAWRWWTRTASPSLLWCASIILSHILADALFTSAPISLLWPLEVHWSTEHCGWLDVIDSVLLGSGADMGLIFGAVLVILFSRVLKVKLLPYLNPRPVRVTSGSGLDGRKPTSPP
jgi:LexA-binding, inner membrane-associated putative hydrolase